MTLMENTNQTHYDDCSGFIFSQCNHNQNGLVTDEERGEIICSPCGQVLHEGLVLYDSKPVHTAEEFMTQSQRGPNSSLTMYDKGLNTNISTKNVDYSGKRMPTKTVNKFKSMRLWDNRSKSRSSGGRSLVSALILLDGLKQKLNLSNTIAEHVAFIYRKASLLHLTRGRSISELMGASVYAACREQGIPRSLDEIANALNIPKKNLARSYRVLVDRLEIKPELANPLDCLSKFCSLLKVNEKVKRHAFRILQQANSKRIVSGSKPAVVCATALYLACIANGERISQAKVHC